MTLRGAPSPARRSACPRGFLARLVRAREGNIILEFAILAPVFLLLLLGTFDIGQMVYAKAVLNGAVQQAARSSSLETANTATADAKVEAVVGPVLPGAQFTTTRLSYFDFADVGRPEQWNDANNNGVCDNGEAYTDENGNGSWDMDVGQSGNGGANDVVLYTVTVTYQPTFPVPFLHNHDGERSLTATAVKKNQPFALQEEYGADAGTCD